jgi:hypothetical protein
MNRRLLVLFAVSAALPALATDKPSGATNAPAGQAPAAASLTSRPVSLALAPAVTVPNRGGSPGAALQLEADVRQNGSALPGFKLTFSVDGQKAGDATTDAAGKATLPWKVPGAFVQKSYEIRADAPHVTGKGTLAVFKSATKMSVGNFSWGTYKGEPGAPSGSYTFLLTRTSDGNALVNPPVAVDVTVNNVPYNPGHIESDAALLPLPPLPAGLTTWKVKVAFAGNASYLPSSDEKTFTKP